METIDLTTDKDYNGIAGFAATTEFRPLTEEERLELGKRFERRSDMTDHFDVFPGDLEEAEVAYTQDEDGVFTTALVKIRDCVYPGVAKRVRYGEYYDAMDEEIARKVALSRVFTMGRIYEE